MRSAASPSLWVLPEVRFGSTAGLLFAATAVCEHLGSTGSAGLVLGTIAVVASLLLPTRYAASIGVIAWAFFTGFFVNVGGQLTLSGGDVRRAALLLGLTVLASLVARSRPSVVEEEALQSSPLVVEEVAQRAVSGG